MNVPMFLAVISEVQFVIASGFLSAAAYGLAWWLQQKKLGVLLFQQEQERGEFQSAFESQKDEMRQQEVAVRKSLEGVVAEKVQIEERFDLFREASQSSENQSLLRIRTLEQELTLNKERAAQLVPTQARIGDLEMALSAERGLHSALEQALEVTRVRADELSQQLLRCQSAYDDLQKHAAERESDLMRRLAECEQSQLARGDDQRVHELEVKMGQIEAESQQKARDDGDKIAELEYQLSEALGAAKNGAEAVGPVAEVESLLVEVKSLLAEKESLQNDLESLTALKGKAVEPVPEVWEQGLLPMDP